MGFERWIRRTIGRRTRAGGEDRRVVFLRACAQNPGRRKSPPAAAPLCGAPGRWRRRAPRLQRGFCSHARRCLFKTALECGAPSPLSRSPGGAGPSSRSPACPVSNTLLKVLPAPRRGVPTTSPALRHRAVPPGESVRRASARRGAGSSRRGRFPTRRSRREPPARTAQGRGGRRRCSRRSAR